MALDDEIRPFDPSVRSFFFEKVEPQHLTALARRESHLRLRRILFAAFSFEPEEFYTKNLIVSLKMLNRLRRGKIRKHPRKAVLFRLLTAGTKERMVRKNGHKCVFDGFMVETSGKMQTNVAVHGILSGSVEKHVLLENRHR